MHRMLSPYTTPADRRWISEVRDLENVLNYFIETMRQIVINTHHAHMQVPTMEEGYDSLATVHFELDTSSRVNHTRDGWIAQKLLDWYLV